MTITVTIRLINKCKKPLIDDKYLRELIKFCEPPGLKNHLLVWTFSYFPNKINTKWDITGIHYWYIKNKKEYNFNHIKIQLKRKMRFKIVKKTKLLKNGYLDFSRMTRDECLVSIIAHEFYHELQDRVDPQERKKLFKFVPDFVPSTKWKKMEEREADAYALKRLREWRKFIYNSDISNNVWRIFDD